MSDTEAERADWIEQVLGFAIPDDRARPGSAPLDVWLRAKQRLDGQIGALQNAFRSIDHPLAKRIADRGLSGFSGRLQVGLQVALMEYQAAGADERPGRAKGVMAATARLRAFLASDRALPVLERNPLGVKVEIRRILGAAADRIDALANG